MVRGYILSCRGMTHYLAIPFTTSLQPYHMTVWNTWIKCDLVHGDAAARGTTFGLHRVLRPLWHSLERLRRECGTAGGRSRPSLAYRAFGLECPEMWQVIGFDTDCALVTDMQ